MALSGLQRQWSLTINTAWSRFVMALICLRRRF
jgi:hypothetical protein